MLKTNPYRQESNFMHTSATKRLSDEARRQLIDIARASRVKTLCLYHHAPARSDDQQDEILQHYRELLAVDELEVIAAYEGLEVNLGGGD